MGLFNRKITVTFIDRKWNKIRVNMKVESVPRVNELVYLGKGEDYYKVAQVINWPSQESRIFIVIESLSNLEEKYITKIKNRGNEI
jgi:hypothetical protein